VGANRIIPAVSIPHPCGNPDLSAEQEKDLRFNIVKKAVTALKTDIESQKIFNDN